MPLVYIFLNFLTLTIGSLFHLKLLQSKIGPIDLIKYYPLSSVQDILQKFALYIATSISEKTFRQYKLKNYIKKYVFDG